MEAEKHLRERKRVMWGERERVAQGVQHTCVPLDTSRTVNCFIGSYHFKSLRSPSVSLKIGMKIFSTNK